MQPSEELTPFAMFIQKCFARLKLGQAAYGTTMFTDYDPLKVCQDIHEEIYDAVNYLYALDEKVRKMERSLSNDRVRKWWDNGEDASTDAGSDS